MMAAKLSTGLATTLNVIPAKAGIPPSLKVNLDNRHGWMPAYAGMTNWVAVGLPISSPI